MVFKDFLEESDMLTPNIETILTQSIYAGNSVYIDLLPYQAL